MNPRELRLLILLLAILGTGGAGILFYQGFVKPLKAYNSQIQRLRFEIDDKDLQLQMTLDEAQGSGSRRLMSLSPSVDMRRRNTAEVPGPVAQRERAGG